jgi:hypothetical protein
MKYRWMDCPKCQCHLVINTTETPEGISGSLRRWSVDRSINDGKLLRIPAAERASDGGFVVVCLCGQTTPVPGKPDAVSAEREGDLRVNLGE